MRIVRGAILDVDGTLVASNDAHAQCWVEALAETGRHVDFQQVRRLIGMGGDKLLPKVSGVDADTPEGKELARRHLEIFKSKYLHTLQPTPMAPELLRYMHDRGLELVVATSAKQEILDQLLKVCGANQFIHAATTSDDAEHSKPDPDIVHAALRKIALPPDTVLMLGDTPYDVTSAAQAGVQTVALRCGGWADKELGGAIAIYDDPADLLARYDQSPFGVAWRDAVAASS